MSEHNTAVAEQPKNKKGNKTTTVDTGATANPAEGQAETPKVKAAKKTSSFRILSGVDASKFRGQRNIVVKALQKLADQHGADKSFTIPQIAAECPELVSKTPVEASVKYHLGGLVSNGEVEEVQTSATEEKAAA